MVHIDLSNRTHVYQHMRTIFLQFEMIATPVLPLTMIFYTPFINSSVWSPQTKHLIRDFLHFSR